MSRPPESPESPNHAAAVDAEARTAGAIDVSDAASGESAGGEVTEPGAGMAGVTGSGPLGLRTDRSLPAMVWGLAIWPLLEQAMSAMVGTVDTALAGRISPQAVEAIGGAGYLLWLMGLLMGVVGVGATAVIARTIGGGRIDEAHRALGQTMLLAVVWSILIAVGFYVVAPLVPRWLSLPEDSAGLFVDYFRLLAISVPAAAVMFEGAAALRGAGDTRSPFWIMLLVNAVNVAVSVLLVQLGHGLFGVAVGTVAGWIVGAVVMLGLLARGRHRLRLKREHLPLDTVMCRRILRIGIPALIENAGYWMSHAIILYFVGTLAAMGLETRPIGSQIIAIRVEAFSFLPGMAFGIAASTLAGQYLGAGDPTTARKAIGWAWLFGAGIMTVLGLSFMLFGEQWTRLMTAERPFVDVVPNLIFHAGWAQIGFGTAMVLSGALRGAGDSRMSMWITFASTYLIRLPGAWVLGVWMGWGLAGIWIALAAELMIRGVLFVVRFVQGGWARVEV